MTRKKVKLAFIANDAARKATFKKRKKGLIKKVSELSTLCGVDACAIIYSPYETQPEVWPSSIGVQRVLSHFKQMPEMEQSKKMMNQESFLRQRIAKASEQLKRQRKDNREKEVTQVMFQCLLGSGLLHLTMMDLTDLGWMIDQNIKEINKRAETLKNGGNPPPHQPAVLQAAPVQPSTAGEAGSNGVPQQESPVQQQADDKSPFELNVESMQRQQWFMDYMNPPPPPHHHPPSQESMAFGGDDMMPPFVDSNDPNALWSNGFFP